jgi:hypothetical protein
MTSTLDIITQGLRESNIIGVNATPTAGEQSEGLARLQALVSSVFGQDVGENLVDWPIGLLNVNTHWPSEFASWNQNIWAYPRTNTRLLLNSDSPQNVYLPPQPDNGSRVSVVLVSQDVLTHNVTLHGNGRLVEGTTTLVLDNPATAERVLMYDADQGGWVAISSLTLDGVMPFPGEFDDYFITKLAMRMNPRYGRAITAETSARLTEMAGQLKARYRQKQNMPADPAVLRTTDPGRYGYMRSGGRYGWMG